MKADCCVALQHLCFCQKVELEHAAKSRAYDQLACEFCTCIGDSTPDQQVEIVCKTTATFANFTLHLLTNCKVSQYNKTL